MLFDHAKSFDFCLIQEMLCANCHTAAGLSSRWPGSSFWSTAIGRQGGVAILVNPNFQGEILSWRRDSNGRIVTLLVSIGAFKINLINIYAPTNLTDCEVFFENLHKFFIPADAVVLGGDFNCHEHDLDKFGSNISLANYLIDFRSTFSLVDVWCKLHPRSRDVSWFNSSFTIGSRLDKFFVSRNIIDRINSCELTPCCFSDHDFLHLDANFDNVMPRGPGLWKFNNSLLADPIFCDFLSARISDLSSCILLFKSAKSWWDFCKESLKQDILLFSKNKHKFACRERVVLTNRLISVKQRLVLGDAFLSSEIASLESRLKALVFTELEHSKIRSPVARKP